MQTLQDQLRDALGDLSMARRREEALKADVAVATAKLEDRGAELAKAQVTHCCCLPRPIVWLMIYETYTPACNPDERLYGGASRN